MNKLEGFIKSQQRDELCMASSFIHKIEGPKANGGVTGTQRNDLAILKKFIAAFFREFRMVIKERIIFK